MTDRPGPQKSADAYRTISEVADELNLPQHVLRFWETRFPQVKPLKRAGGRRFYRPEDVALLRAVQALLYGEGYTIKGVQRLLAEHGPRQVADALERARAAPAATRDAGSDAAVPEREPAPVRREPAPALPVPSRAQPAVSVPPGPASDPAAGLPEAPARGVARHPAAGGASVADRLAGVLADLDACSRLLASARSTQN